MNSRKAKQASSIGILLAATSLLLPACEWDGHFTVLGYTTRPNYDCSIRTIRVPIFTNRTVQDTVRRGVEMDLTRAVVREIELKTPYKVVGKGEPADTELIGTIISYNKLILNRNQLNEVREAETTLGVEIVWRDLRPGHEGEVLSRPQRGPVLPGVAVAPQLGTPAGSVLPPIGIAPPTQPLPPTTDAVPLPPGVPPPPPPPILVQSVARFIPELGESFTTARKRNIDNLAVQIVSMMEIPW